ncbi:MAG: beta-lactamase family protein, partial [Deltaproteobacteria bacterium]|nr:beta-lactamase family protein [Deltaproteobacteria bacterium]
GGCGSDAAQDYDADEGGDAFVEIEEEPDIAGDGDGDAAKDSFEIEEIKPVDPALAAHLQALLEEYVTFSGEPGMGQAIILADGASWKGAAGLADILKKEALDTEKGYRVGSNTKPYIATTIMLLAEEGKLSIDDPVSKHLTQYPQWSQVTLRHLMGMRSGIPDYLQSEQLWIEVVSNPGEPIAPEKLVSFVSSKPLEYTPGENGTYSNTNFILLGMIIEKATGGKIQDEIDKRIVKPVGLANTFLDTGAKEAAGLSHGYMDVELAGFVLNIAPELMSLVPPEYFVAGPLLDCTYLFHPSIAWSAGAIVSTPADAAKFMKALLTGKVVSEASLAEMMKFLPIGLLGNQTDYGLGLVRYATPYGTAYGHGGLTFGYDANALYIPDKEVAMGDMHNFFPAQSWSLTNEVMKAAVEGVVEPLIACGQPDDLFGTQEGHVVELKFRGKINPNNTLFPSYGIANVRMNSGDETTPFYGIASSAKVVEIAGQNRVEISSFGPASEGDVKVRQMTMNMRAELLETASDEGTILASPLFPYDVFVTTSDINLDPLTKEPTKYCVTSVIDLSNKSVLYLCDHESYKAETGAMLKVFGSVSVTVDETAIESYLSPLTMPRCACNNGDNWEACGE